MNSLFVSRIHPECTFFRPITMYLLSASRFTINTQSKSRIRRLFREFPEITMIHHLLRDFTRNSSFFRKFIVCFANSPWIHFFAKSLWTHYLLRDFTMTTLSFSRVDFLFREFSMYSLSVSRFLFEFTFSFGKSLSVYYEFTMNFSIIFANEIWINYLHRELSIHSLFHVFTINLLNE